MSVVNRGVPSIERARKAQAIKQAKELRETELAQALQFWLDDKPHRGEQATLSENFEILNERDGHIEDFLKERNVRPTYHQLAGEQQEEYKVFVVQMLSCVREISETGEQLEKHQVLEAMSTFHKGVNWDDDKLKATYNTFMASMSDRFLFFFTSSLAEEIKLAKEKHDRSHHNQEKQSIRQKLGSAKQSFLSKFKKQDEEQDHGHHHHEAELAASLNPLFVDLLQREDVGIKQAQVIVDGLGYDPRELLLQEQANKKPPSCGNPNHSHSGDETKVFLKNAGLNFIEMGVEGFIAFKTGSLTALANALHGAADVSNSLSSAVFSLFSRTPKRDASAGLVGSFFIAATAAITLGTLFQGGLMESFGLSDSLWTAVGATVGLMINTPILKGVQKIKESFNRQGEEAHAKLDILGSKSGFVVSASILLGVVTNKYLGVDIPIASIVDKTFTTGIGAFGLGIAYRLARPSLSVLLKLKPSSVKKSDYQMVAKKIESSLQEIESEMPVNVALEQVGVNSAKVNVLVKKSVKDSWSIFGKLTDKEQKTFTVSLLHSLTEELGTPVTEIEVLSYNKYPNNHDQAFKDPSVLNESYVYSAGAPTVTAQLKRSLTEEQLELRSQIERHPDDGLLSSLLVDSESPYQRALVDHIKQHGPESQKATLVAA